MFIRSKLVPGWINSKTCTICIKNFNKNNWINKKGSSWGEHFNKCHTLWVFFCFMCLLIHTLSHDQIGQLFCLEINHPIQSILDSCQILLIQTFKSFFSHSYDCILKIFEWISQNKTWDDASIRFLIQNPRKIRSPELHMWFFVKFLQKSAKKSF